MLHCRRVLSQKSVVARPAIEWVLARATDQHIVACATKQLVIAFTTDQHVVSVASGEREADGPQGALN